MLGPVSEIFDFEPVGGVPIRAKQVFCLENRKFKQAYLQLRSRQQNGVKPNTKGNAIRKVARGNLRPLKSSLLNV